MATVEPARACYTLTWEVREGEERTYEWPASNGWAITIGRSVTSDVSVEHPTISRRHAEMAVRGGQCWLRDLASTYGTMVNGARISDEVALTPGDTFHLGRTRFVLGLKVPPPAPAVMMDGPLPDPATTIVRPVVPIPTQTHPAPDVPSPQAARLLKLLSEITRSLVQRRNLDDTLRGVLDLVFEAVAAERAFLLLRDSAFDPLTPRVARAADGRPLTNATLSRTVVNAVIRDRVAMLADDALVDSRLDLAQSVQVLSIRSFLCAPLWNQNDVIGVLYADTPRSRRFSEDDLAVFVALANYAAVAIEHARLSERVAEESRRRERLQRYHSPGVVNRILSATTDPGVFDTQVRDLTVMFVDLVGFTTLSEGMEPDAVADLLNEFFHEMADVLFDHQGTLDKFVGDAILAVFGAPLPQEDHAAKAVRAALDMRKALADLNARHPDRAPLRTRVGIHTGRALTGDIGSPMRCEFTVLGDAVNTASRLETTVAQPGQIVISKATLDRTGDEFTVIPLGPVTLRGRQATIDAYAVEG